MLIEHIEKISSNDDTAALAAAATFPAVDVDDHDPSCEEPRPLSATSQQIRTLSVLTAAIRRDLATLTARLEEVCSVVDQFEDSRQRGKVRQRAQRQFAAIEARALRARGLR